ncbi:TerB N-terminal domain-containing protein [Pseudomonas sp. MDMC216]|uniref:tellurite resistance TerB family protein n=1 Tax=Ectopseudomonas guguanensis TaxID=1198456 RepID=UPI000DC22A78|nr:MULTISPECIES: TerB N-terminal domain-containing protein [Pseudomonas]MDI5991811.1 TerB N-terminal domain-containing protein [Pseudomonas sp. MDMC216]MDI6006197.1 TerB N-terminal domain-containing protein [Pseudomonas sp. MDMC17]MPT17042.1 Tellurite resistance protein TerB [Pseudomonas sp.]RAR35240.1 Tellurite resistance protein TerB [Pseudomonas sp. MDMC224]WJH57121.1 Tellurite resistance protein TerB [Pseudomonas guguanensis]
MARKRRNKSEISGVAILGVLFLGAIASIPKEAWIALAGVGVIGFGVWLIVKANSDSSRTAPPVMHPQHRPPSSRNRPRAVETDPNRGLVFSLDEVEIEDQAHTGSTRELAPAAEEKVRRRADSEFFTVTLEVSKPSSYRLPSAPATLTDEKVRWIPAGEFVEVAGEKIPGGMIYVGAGRTDRCAAPEPSLINPKLKVARGVVDIAERLTGYWASYDSISPEARRAYLQWLSSGRKAPHANIGYVFLFFYGLERRVFVDAKSDPNAAAEIAGIVSEVERLLVIYGGSGSFSNYAGRFLAFLRMGETPPRRYLAPPPDNQAYGYEMPIELRIGLGQLATDKQRLPAAWALAWALADHSIGKRTPVSRCQDAFATLFKIKYEQLHGDGMVLPQNKTRLKLQYNTASAALPVQTLEGLGDIPDVTATSAPRKKLQQIVDECTAELEPYSRYLGRNPDTPEALEGLLQLPIMLWPAVARAELDALKQRIGDGMVVMSFGELAGRLKSAGALSRDKVIALARALESLHIGIEPDVLAGSKTPKAEDTVALFATQIEDGDLRASPAYNAASVTLDLACAVAAADGDTSPEEIMLLSRHVDSWNHLSGAHRKRLKAHLRLQLNQPPTLQSLKKKLEPLASSAKRTVAAFLAHLAQVDGEVSPAEVKLLERVYKALQLDSQLLYGDLHVAASSASTSTAPTVASVPTSSASPASVTGFALDHDRIFQLQRETEQVSALLAQVFVDEQIVEPEEPDISGASDDTSSICGLDADHSAFLRLLVSRMEWSREELEAVASDMDLMLDGALEHINDMAFEHFDMSITEGEDPLEINPDIMGKLPL